VPPHPGRGAAALVLILVLILVLAGCTDGRGSGPTVTTTPPRAGGTLHLALLAPRSLDPAQAESDSERIIADSLFDGLTRLDPEGRAAGAVAASWTADAGQRRFEFKLRPEARFAGGEPVRAQDFVTAWRRVAASPRPGVRGLLAKVEGAAAGLGGVTAPAEDTLVVQLTEAMPAFPAVAADPALAPVPPAATGAGTKDWAARPTGNGPFALIGRPNLDRVVLGRSQAYPGRRTWLDRVDITTVPDPQTAWLAFQEGQVQYAPVPVDQLAAARQLFGTAGDERTDPGLIEGSAAAIDVLELPASGPLAQPEVRLAVAHAIDREGLVEALGGAGVAADGLVPDGVRRGGPIACPACAYDPTQATQALAKAGKPKLTVAPGAGAVGRQLAGLVAGDLRDAGARATVGTGPAAGAVELRTVAAGAATADAPGFLTGLTELTGEASGEVGQLLGEASVAGDDDARLELARQAEEQAAADILVVPLVERRQTAVLAPGVQGLDLTPLGLIDLAEVSLTG
jgi:oligopeptide transport system substrate-binding protein